MSFKQACELSVVMPAYREADSLRMLLPKLVPAVAALSADAEIVVIDAEEPWTIQRRCARQMVCGAKRVRVERCMATRFAAASGRATGGMCC